MYQTARRRLNEYGTFTLPTDRHLRRYNRERTRYISKRSTQFGAFTSARKLYNRKNKRGWITAICTVLTLRTVNTLVKGKEIKALKNI